MVVAGRRETEGNETVELIRAAGGDALFVQTDVSKANEVQTLIEKAVQKFGLDWTLPLITQESRVPGFPSSNNPKRSGIRPSISISKEYGFA